MAETASSEVNPISAGDIRNLIMKLWTTIHQNLSQERQTRIQIIGRLQFYNYHNYNDTQNLLTKLIPRCDMLNELIAHAELTMSKIRPDSSQQTQILFLSEYRACIKLLLEILDGGILKSKNTDLNITYIFTLINNIFKAIEYVCNYHSTKMRKLRLIINAMRDIVYNYDAQTLWSYLNKIREAYTTEGIKNLLSTPNITSVQSIRDVLKGAIDLIGIHNTNAAAAPADSPHPLADLYAEDKHYAAAAAAPAENTTKSTKKPARKRKRDDDTPDTKATICASIFDGNTRQTRAREKEEEEPTPKKPRIVK